MTLRRVVLLVLVAAALAFPIGAARDLWVLDEVRYAGVVEAMHKTGHWFAPSLNGEFYDHKPPMYFWCVGALTTLTGGQSAFILYVIAWLLGLACIVAAYFLARALLPERTAWLAAVVMASSFLFVVCAGNARMDLMMVAFMVLGLLAFVRGCLGEKRRLYVWFFVCCALAVMTKGPYGIVLPLVTVLVFLAWERRLKELCTPWFLLGLLIGLGVIGAWLAGLVAVEGTHVLRAYFVKQTFGRMAGSWAHAEPFWFYAAWLPIEFLPWIAFVPGGFVRMKRQHPAAFRFMLALAASNLVVLSAVSCKLWVYILPVWPALACAAAVRLCEAAEGRRPRGFKIETTITAALLVVLGAVAYGLCSRHFPSHIRPVAVFGGVLALCGAVAIAAAWLPHRSVKRRVMLVGGVLIVCGLAFSRLTTLVLTPAFNESMSPKAAGEQMARYAAQGYTLATCGVPFGTYNYHAHQLVIAELDAADLPRYFDDHPRAVVAIRAKDFEAVRDALPGVRIVGEHVLENKTHLLLVSEHETGRTE